MKMDRMFSVFLSLLIISSSGCLSGEVDEFYGEDISPPISVDDFVLVDENGDTVAMSDFEGKVVVVAFLFTRCPDICPVVSANLAFVEQELGDLHGSSVQILTVTVDPWTDNASVLNNYASTRELGWPHLTGAVEDLEPVWMNFDVGLTRMTRMWTTTESRMDSIVAPIRQKVKRSITTGVERRPSSRRETS